jgi:hypothetical protein
VGWASIFRYGHRLALLLIFLVGPAFALGGGGPTPFNYIENFPLDVQVLSTQGGVKDFVYLDLKSTVLYRNEYDQLHAVDLSHGYDYYMSRAAGPLSEIIDASERFVTSIAGDNSYVLDTGSYPAQWEPLFSGVQLQPAFWKGSTFYGVSLGMSDPQHYQLNIYENDLKSNGGGTQLCNIQFDATMNSQLASGHAYPYIYFYSTQETSQGTVLYMSKVNVQKSLFHDACEVTQDLLWAQALPGPVQQVDRFPALNSASIKFDFDAYNLLWVTPNGPIWYDIGNEKMPIILNHGVSTIATWNQDDGLTFVFLNDAVAGNTMAGFPIASVGANDLQLSSDGTTAIFTPQFEDETSRWMLQLNFEMMRHHGVPMK